MPPAAIIGGTAAIGAIGGYLGSREQRKAAEAAAGPSFSQGTRTTTPTGPLIPGLTDLGLSALGLAGIPLPEYPNYQPFGFHRLPDPGIEFFDFEPIELERVPGASGESRRILAEILGLAHDKSAFVEPAERSFEEVLAGEGNPFLDEAGRMLRGGPLFDLSRNIVADPFLERVLEGIRGDIDESLEEQLAEIEAGASGLGRTGSPAVGRLSSEAREAALEAVARASAQARSADFQQGRQLQAGAAGQLASLAGQLAALRSNERLGALSLAPALEDARFAGLDLAGPLSTNIDRLNQQAVMSNVGFALQQHLADAGFDAQAVQDALALYGIQSRENIAANQIAAANAQAQNAFNLQEFGFDVQAPFLRYNQIADLVLPIAGLTTGTTETFSNTSQGPAPYTPSPYTGALLGGLGGLMTGYGLQQSLGGGGGGTRGFYSLPPNQATSFVPVAGSPVPFFGGFR